MPFSNDRIIFYGSFDSSPSPPTLLPARISRDGGMCRRQCERRRPPIMWRAVKYQSTGRRPEGETAVYAWGGAGWIYGNRQPIKAAVWGGICHSDLPLPWAGGPLKSRLRLPGLRAKEVVLQRLKWLRRLIRWAIVEKGCSGSGTHYRRRKLQRGKGLRGCVYCTHEWKGGRKVILWEWEEVSSRYVPMSVCCKWAAGEKERVWDCGSLLFTLTFAWGMATLTFSISLLISISAKMKIVADLRLN